MQQQNQWLNKNMKAQKNTTRNPQISQKNQKSQVRLIGILFLQPETPKSWSSFCLTNLSRTRSLQENRQSKTLMGASPVGECTSSA